ncbi:hypothetical protein, partial [Mesorhizobium sp. P5_C1]
MADDEETAARETASRSRWSTALVSAFGGPFGGFLWIGSGRLAAASLVVVSAISLVLIYIGFPVFPGVDLAWLANLSGIALMIVWVALVLPLRRDLSRIGSRLDYSLPIPNAAKA